MIAHAFYIVYIQMSSFYYLSSRFFAPRLVRLNYQADLADFWCVDTSSLARQYYRSTFLNFDPWPLFYAPVGQAPKSQK